jgi:hypothetical protein
MIKSEASQCDRLSNYPLWMIMNRNRWNGSDAGKVIRSTTSASSKRLTRFGGTFRLSHVDSCSSFVAVSLPLSHMSQNSPGSSTNPYWNGDSTSYL